MSDSQKALIELQVADQQLKQMQEYLENFETQILSVSEILTSLDDYEKMKPGSKILVPLQNGIFMEATLSDKKTLKMNIGSNTIVDKTVEESREMMKKQLDAIEIYKAEITSQVNNLTLKIQELQKISGQAQ